MSFLRGSSLPGSNMNRSGPMLTLDDKSIYERYDQISHHIDTHGPNRKTFMNSAAYALEGSKSVYPGQSMTTWGKNIQNVQKSAYRPSLWNEPEAKPYWGNYEPQSYVANQPTLSLYQSELLKSQRWANEQNRGHQQGYEDYDNQNDGRPQPTFAQTQTMGFNQGNRPQDNDPRYQEQPQGHWDQRAPSDQQQAPNNQLPSQIQNQPPLSQTQGSQQLSGSQADTSKPFTFVPPLKPTDPLKITRPAYPFDFHDYVYPKAAGASVKAKPDNPKPQPGQHTKFEWPPKDGIIPAGVKLKALEKVETNPLAPPPRENQQQAQPVQQPQQGQQPSAPAQPVQSQPMQKTVRFEDTQAQPQQSQPRGIQQNTAGGGLKPNYEPSPDNPFNTMSQQQYDAYKQQNTQTAAQNPLRPANAAGGGLKTSYESSPDNPFNTMSQQQYEAYKQQNAVQEPLRPANATAGGLKTSYESSPDNPFNTMSQQQYDAYKQQNTQTAAQNPLKAATAAGGGLKTTNESSPDNPFNTMSQQGYQQYAQNSQTTAQAAPLNPAVGGPGIGGGIRPGNVSSENNPLNPQGYPQDQGYPTQGGAGAGPSTVLPQRPLGVVDDYWYLPPKERLAAKKRDHYMGGSGGSMAAGPTTRGPGDRSNDVSAGNPLAMHSQAFYDHYKQVNNQMVNNDPFKKNSKGQRVGGGGGFPGSSGMGGGAGGDDGYTRKKGGIAMNL